MTFNYHDRQELDAMINRATARVLRRIGSWFLWGLIGAVTGWLFAMWMAS